MDKKEKWLAQLITLVALAEYLEEKGWTVSKRRLVDVFTSPGLCFEDGKPIELVLPASQQWDWCVYRETAIGLIAAVENRDALWVIFEMLDFAPDIDIPGLLGQFDTANPSPDSVPF